MKIEINEIRAYLDKVHKSADFLPSRQKRANRSVCRRVLGFLNNYEFEKKAEILVNHVFAPSFHASSHLDEPQTKGELTFNEHKRILDLQKEILQLIEVRYKLSEKDFAKPNISLNEGKLNGLLVKLAKSFRDA
ncbi:hypothetical protein [Flagellimonas sp.]|uniref:hypothetical protein n=1 Tax=Flagellimonas sp. TaxID=2058762 RepID=UPI003BA9DC20